MSKKDLFTLKEIAEVLKVPESTCRQWHHWFEDFLIYRQESGERKYSQESLEVFQFIARRLEDHIPPDDIKAELSTTVFPVIIDERNDFHVDQVATPLKANIAAGLISSIKNLLFELAPTAKRFFERIIKDAVSSALQGNLDQQVEIRMLNRKITALESKIDRMSEMIARTNEKAVLSPPSATPVNRASGISTPEEKKRHTAGTAYQVAILKAILELKDEKRLPFHQIAKLFEKKGFVPLGKQPWHPIGISALYQRAQRAPKKE